MSSEVTNEQVESTTPEELKMTKKDKEGFIKLTDEVKEETNKQDTMNCSEWKEVSNILKFYVYTLTFTLNEIFSELVDINIEELLFIF